MDLSFFKRITLGVALGVMLQIYSSRHNCVTSSVSKISRYRSETQEKKNSFHSMAEDYAQEVSGLQEFRRSEIRVIM